MLRLTSLEVQDHPLDPLLQHLWASLSKIDLTIHYAKPTSKTSVCVAYMNYPLDLSSTGSADPARRWLARLLDRAYGASQRQKRIKVLINPFGGAGKAGKLFAQDIEPIFAAAQCELDVERTAYMGHAVEIAEKIDIEAYDVIASCSGDGLPHEVFNGLARKSNAAEALRKVAVVQLPCGTGNAMSWNLNGTGSCSMAAMCIVKGIRTPLDLVSITQGNKRTISFLSQAIGIVAETDLGTDNIRWMGDARFTYGFFVRLLGKTVYSCDIAIQTDIADKQACKEHYANEVIKYQKFGSTLDVTSSSDSLGQLRSSSSGLPELKFGTVNDTLPSGWKLVPYPTLGNFYCGNMAIMTESAPFFPAALPSDGLQDLIMIDGNIGRTKAISSLLAVEKGTFYDLQHVNVRKVSAFRVVPKFGRWADANAKKSKQGLVSQLLKAVGISGGRSGENRDGGYISIDGERMPFEPFQAEVHRGLGTVLSKNGGVYESPGPTGWESARSGASASALTNSAS